jgi:3-oxoacyl-[acyl-carrier-protein] synthase-3
MSRSAVLGIGHYLPPMTERAGVIRPIADPPPGTSELGAHASRAAMNAAGVGTEDVDFIVFATINPDVTFPGAACYLQDKLGCGTVGALDVRAQCAGFICALMVADQFVRNGQYKRVLIVGADIHSVWVDYSPAGVELARRFGDAGGAAILGPANGDAGVLATALHMDGSRHEKFWCEYPASRQHPTRIIKENLHAGKHFPKMDVADVGAFGLEKLPEVIREVSSRASVPLDRVDHVILSHVLPEVAEKVAGDLGLGKRSVIASPKYGHLGAASLPVALSEEVQAGRMGAGATVCLATAGAGYSWGAAIVRL